jgi:hypothetical protein
LLPKLTRVTLGYRGRSGSLSYPIRRLGFRPTATKGRTGVRTDAQLVELAGEIRRSVKNDPPSMQQVRDLLDRVLATPAVARRRRR